jgi:predicted component of type VI protein secretion system
MKAKKKILHPRAAPKIQSENKIDFWCFNATFSNISAISWRPVLVVEEAGENHPITASSLPFKKTSFP